MPIKTQADLDKAIDSLAPIVDEICQKLELTTAASREFIKAHFRNFKIFDNKQHDYGSKNISSFGTLGVVIRMNDKWERMRNLFTKTKKARVKESIADTMCDIGNYSVIYRMLEDGKWPDEK